MTLRSTHVRRAGAAFTLVALLLSSGVSRGDAPQREAVVVEVTPRGSLDAYRLRAAIGVELGVDAVGADDPKAEQARGTFTVGVDQATHHLTVSYKARSDAIDRTVDLPGDPEAAQRAAVVLAGNLGRDEASELAAQLRRTPGDVRSPPTTPSTAPPAPKTKGAAGEATAEQENLERNARDMQGALDYAAAKDRGLRTALVVTTVSLLAVGAGAIVATPWLRGGQPTTSSIGDGFAASVAPFSVAIAGALYPSAVGGGLGDAADAARRSEDATTTAGIWVRRAAAEHSSRRVGGVILLVGGVLELGLGLFAAMVRDPSWDDSARTYQAGSAITSGAFFTLLGVAFRASDGPVEDALHSYERAHGIPLWKLADHVALAPIPGGGSAGFRTSF